MLTRTRIVVLAGLVMLLTSTLGGCGLGMGDPAQPYFGWAVIGGAPTVYVPVCAEDPVKELVLKNEPDAHASIATASTIVWRVSSPTTDEAKIGFITLGKDTQFATVSEPLSGNVPQHASVTVTTYKGKQRSDILNDTRAARAYPAGTHLDDISFTVQNGPKETVEMTAAKLRAAYLKTVGQC